MTFSALLRAETRQTHRIVERAFALDDRLVDRRAYAELLMTLRDFHRPAEDNLRAVDGWGQMEPDIEIESRLRAALLDEDLNRLGVGPPSGDALDRTGLPELSTLGRGIGCLYVLEGSALGGRIIARRARIALGDAIPVAFFSSAGRPDPGATWRDLQKSMDAFGEAHGPAGATDAITAARQTFLALRDRLRP